MAKVASGRLLSAITRMLASSLVSLACVAPLHAHHSISVVEISEPVWFAGTVLRYEPRHPHVMLTLEDKSPDGTVHQWTVEGPNLLRLQRMAVAADFLKPGDRIQVCGFRLKPPHTKEHFVHGQVLVMPDGLMRHWGPYGKLDNCVRGGDKPSAWVDFLDRDAMARSSWCTARIYASLGTVAPAATVATVNRDMASPCQ